jgi:hypothetical protein
MSSSRFLRPAAAGLLIMLALGSLAFLPLEPGAPTADSPLGVRLLELAAQGSIFLPTLLAGPLLLLCAGALVAGGWRDKNIDGAERRRWRVLLTLWPAGLLIPRLMALPWMRDALETALPVLGVVTLVGLISVAAMLKAQGAKGALSPLLLAALIVLPFLNGLGSVRGAQELLPGLSWLAVGLLLAAGVAGGRAGRWLLWAGLALALLGSFKTWRTHLIPTLASLDAALIVAWLVHRQTRALLAGTTQPATRLGLRLAPVTMALTWLGLLAMAGDNCLVLAYLRGLHDPTVDFGVCSPWYPGQLWQLGGLYRTLLALGALPLAGLALHSLPRRRWHRAAAPALAVAAGLALFAAFPNLSGHFGGWATAPVARATAGCTPRLYAAGVGLHAYNSPECEWESVPHFALSQWEEDPEDAADPAEETTMCKPAGGPQVVPRSWRPEPLLFEPMVLTDDQGLAAVEVEVPGQLTEWQLIALAHTRSGRQGGDGARFVSTLPLSVHLIEPIALREGDRAELPVRVANSSDEPWTGRLSARAAGAAHGSLDEPIALAPHSSAVRFLQVRATAPGWAELSAEAGPDRVERKLRVLPTGRLELETARGTLAAPHALEIATPVGTKRGGGAVALTVYPGPAGFIAQEAQRVRPTSSTEAAYSLALHTQGQRISSKLGSYDVTQETEDARVRARHELARRLHRAGIPEQLGALAALAHSADPECQILSARLAEQIRHEQLVDGSLPLGDITLERSLVASAEAARLTAGLEPMVASRAAGHLERHASQVRDPYTAVVLASSGVIRGPQLEALQALVREAAEPRPDGGVAVEPTPLSIRLDGERPGTLETTARALTALAMDPGSEALVANLGATLLGSYRPRQGFGDGLAGMAVLDALEQVFQAPLPERVQLSLTVEGEVAQQREWLPTDGFVPMLLEAPLPDTAGPHRVSIEATPPLPGFTWILERSAWLPWGEPRAGAAEIRVQAPTLAQVGRRILCVVRASVPAGERFEILLELPPGLEQWSRARLRPSARGGGARSTLVIHSLPLDEGDDFISTVELIPTTAGTLHWGAARLRLLDRNEEIQVPIGVLEVTLEGGT